MSKTAVIPACGLIGAALREAVTTEMSAVARLVEDAIRKQLGRDYVELEAIFPDRVVVRTNGRYTAYPYSIDENNQVQLGAPVEVVEQYVAVREAVQKLRDQNGEAFLEAIAQGGGRWQIRVIRAGLSSNKVFYPDAILREAAPLFAGARVFVKSDDEHLKGKGKDVRNLIGQIENPRFIEGQQPDTGEIQGELMLIEPQGSIAVKLREAFDRHLTGLFGFSIDANGKARMQMREGKRINMATAITSVSSVDLIVEPGAGGELIRLIEAVNDDGNHKEHPDMALRQRMIEAIQAHNKVFDGVTATDDQIELAYREAVAAGIKPALPPATVNPEVLEERVRMIEARAQARSSITTSTLPQPAKERLLADFERRTRFVEADVTAAITAEREYLSRFTESGKPVIHFDDIHVEDRSTKIGEMLDAFFNENHKEHRNVQSFRECYIEITGDRRVTGDIQDCDRTRMAESLGMAFRESVNTNQFAMVLGNSLRRSMLSEYTDAVDYDLWRHIANVVPLADFRTNDRVSYGGYGSLPIVQELGGYYLMGTPGEEKSSYAAQKRGGMEEISLEAIRNDDVGAIRLIPQKLARAAKRTLAKFVLDFLRNNALAGDSLDTFHVGHGNLFTGALSTTEFSKHRLAMLQQMELGSNERLGIGPASLLVPMELQEKAADMFVRDTNLDKTFLQTLTPTIIPVWYWEDPDDWYTAANKKDIPGIEIGFLDGREEPELFVQDMPNVGSLFSNDKLTYKIRHIYGGCVTNWRAFTKAAVL